MPSPPRFPSSHSLLSVSSSSPNSAAMADMGTELHVLHPQRIVGQLGSQASPLIHPPPSPLALALSSPLCSPIIEKHPPPSCHCRCSSPARHGKGMARPLRACACLTNASHTPLHTRTTPRAGTSASRRRPYFGQPLRSPQGPAVTSEALTALEAAAWPSVHRPPYPDELRVEALPA